MQAIFKILICRIVPAINLAIKKFPKNFNEAQSSINRWDTLSSRPGVLWKLYSQRDVQSKSQPSIFRLFIDEHMLRSSQKYAIKHG